MKSPAILCTLILIHACSVQSMNLNFGHIFPKHDMQSGTQQRSGLQQQQLAPVSNQPLPSTHQEQKIEYEYPPQDPSESYSEYRSESDPYLYNMSSDQDVISESSWNSSYESGSISEQQPEQSNSTTTSTSTTSGVKEHSNVISNAVESHYSNKSTTSESSGGGEGVWNKVTAAPPASPTSSSAPIRIITSAAANATSDGEKEKVVLGTAETTTEVVQKSIFQKSIEWVKDDYILSFLVPVAAGVISAVSVICTIALCRCCRRCCRRRRFRKKCLPDSVRNLSSSDRKRLLGDMSSDDEF